MKNDVDYEVEIPDFELTEEGCELLASLFAPLVLGKDCSSA